jgi:hypothetical protein
MSMTIRATLAAVAAIVISGAAVAAPPANKDACLAKAFELADQSAKKKLPEAQAAKVEQLVTALEADCVGTDMTKAEASIKAVEDAIAGK